MLEVPNLGHMTTSTVEFNSNHKMLWMTPETQIMTLQPLLRNTFILTSPAVAIFGV